MFRVINLAVVLGVFKAKGILMNLFSSKLLVKNFASI